MFNFPTNSRDNLVCNEWSSILFLRFSYRHSRKSREGWKGARGGLKEHVHLVHSWCGPSESQEVQRSQGGVPRDDLIQRRTIDKSAQWAKEGRNLQLY